MTRSRFARPKMASVGLLAFLVLHARGAHAQAVSGVVRSATDASSLSGAIVILVSSSGARLAGTLTDDGGRYRLTAPAPGTFTLRVDLVGYRSAIVPEFRLDSGVSVTRDIVFRFERIELPRVTVTAASSCTSISGNDGAAPQLWAEARKTLEAARLAAEERRFSVSIRRHDRTISLPDSVLRASRTWTITGVSRNPFESLAPAVVARDGFSVLRDRVLEYYAPDAAILLSDEFVAGHCFGTRRGGPDGAVGLTFRPARGDARLDIDGVLWLDSASAELRSLEYRYVPAPSKPNVAGGVVAFGRYPSGLWGVQRWSIRLPVFQVHEATRRPDGALGRFVDTLVTAFRDEGGELITSLSPGVTTRSSGSRLTGTVVDSTLRAPLPGAVVTIGSLGRTATTDSVGRFDIDSIDDDGVVRVRVWHARLDSLEVGAQTTDVRLRRGAETTADLTLPVMGSVAGGRCRRATRPSRIIMGVVRSDSGPAPAAEVVLVERRTGTADSRDSLVRHVEYSSDAGRFAFCGVQPGAHGWLLVKSGSGWTVPRHVSGERAASVDVVHLTTSRLADVVGDSLAPPGTVLGRTLQGQASRIHGWVLLASEAQGAVQVLVDDVHRTSAAPDGAFQLSNVPVGTRRLTFRAPAHAATQLTVSVEAGQSLLLLATMKPAPAVVVVRRPVVSDTRLADFRKRRRAGGGGIFIDRADIERRNPRTVADLLRAVPGVRIMSVGGGYRLVSTHFRRLDQATAESGACDLMLYLDGLPSPQDGNIESRIPINEIGAIEVYVSAASVPRQFAGTGAACGVILIWRG